MAEFDSPPQQATVIELILEWMHMATKIPVRSASARMSQDDEYEIEDKKPAKPTTIALAVAGVVAAASAIYFLGVGERGERNREKVKSWAIKAREDIKARLDEMKDTDLEEIGALIEDLKNRVTKPSP